MKIRVRQAIAVALVATALASDRSLAAAAQQKPERLPESKNLVTRLTQHLRRTVVGAKIQLLAREDRFAPVQRLARIVAEDTFGSPQALLSDFQLHLPPPTL